MIGDPVTMCEPHAERQHRKREDRQQKDRAERADQPDLVDPERTDGHQGHQSHPDPTNGPVRQCALGAANWIRPSPNAAIAAKAWSGIWGAASSSGARLMTMAHAKAHGITAQPRNQVLARDCNILTGDREIQAKPPQPKSPVFGLSSPAHHTASTGAAFTAPVYLLRSPGALYLWPMRALRTEYRRPCRC